MKKIVLLAFTLFVAFADTFAQKEVSGVYVGGHIRRERPGTITKLRNSGFTYAILFNVHVTADGTLTTDGDTICYNGKYVFQNKHPYYQQDVANLKTAPTSITRVEICIGGWGNDAYTNIKNLINSKGTGSTTMLYRNFKALKQAVPEIDAVNNDIEQDYDVETGAKFHIMMYNLGYKTTLAPYTYKSYWTSLNDKIRASKPKAVDRVMIQCYDGGAGNVNSVGTWNFNGVTERHAGLMYYSNDWSVDKNMAQFQKWKDDGVATGGFVWVYNDESWDLNAWASGMNRIFGAVTVHEEQVVVRCYSEKNYGGYCIALPEGRFTQADLAVYGLKANDLSSLEIVDDFYQIKLYKSPDFTGTARRFTKSMKSITTYDNLVCSIIIEPNPTGINSPTPNSTPEREEIYDLSGQKVNGKLPRGIYIVNGKKILY